MAVGLLFARLVMATIAFFGSNSKYASATLSSQTRSSRAVSWSVVSTDTRFIGASSGETNHPSSSPYSFSEEHALSKPNDEHALHLMDHAAKDIMTEFKDIVLAFGESDEYRQASHVSS